MRRRRSGHPEKITYFTVEVYPILRVEKSYRMSRERRDRNSVERRLGSVTTGDTHTEPIKEYVEGQSPKYDKGFTGRRGPIMTFEVEMQWRRHFRKKLGGFLIINMTYLVRVL